MAKRTVLHIKGCEHENPIPTAVKIGNMVFTSAMIGSDPETGEVPENIENEIKFLFNYLKEIMNAAGGSTDDIAHLSVYVSDREYKKLINPHWIEMFPNPNDRPARHTTVKNLKPGLRVQFEMVAVL